MTIVNVPIAGEVEFPDSMSDGDIVKAIETDIIPSVSPSGATKMEPPGTVQPKIGSALAPSPFELGQPPSPEADIERQHAQQMEGFKNGPIEIGAQSATLPRFGQKGTYLGELGELGASLGEWALNKPEEVAASLYPPTAAAITARYGAPLAKHWLSDVYKATQGDKDAANRALALFTVVATPMAFKKGADLLQRAKTETEMKAQYDALVDLAARENLHPGSAPAEPPSVAQEALDSIKAVAPATAQVLEKEVKPTPIEAPTEEIKPPLSQPEAAPPIEAPTTATVSSEEKGVGETAHLPSAISQSTTQPETAQAPAPEVPAEIVGMGGAVPSEFEVPKGTPTGIKNAIVDQERIQRGLPPAMQAAKQTFGEVWDRAMATVDQDPGAIDRFLDSVRDNPRAATAHEVALLLNRQIDLQNEYNKATRDLNQAYDDARHEDVEVQKARVAQLSDQLKDVYDIGKAVGTETSRGLNIRKMLANEDFSLASLEMDMRASKGGRQLTDQERTEMQKVHDEYQAKLKEAEARETVVKQQLAESQAARVLAEIKAQAVPQYSPKVLGMAENFAKFMDTKADAALSRLREKLRRASAGIDPTILSDVAIIGAAKLTRAVVDWGGEMVRDLGEWIRPHLEEARAAAEKLQDEELGEFVKPLKKEGESVRKKIKDMTPAERLSDLQTKIKHRMDSGDGKSITPLVQKLARHFVSQGVTKVSDLVDAVHAAIKEIAPDMSKRDTMDAISGYGEYKNLTKDAISVKLRDLKGQMQQLGKLEDIAEKKAPLRTGIERRVPTAEESDLIKAVNKAKRTGDYTVTDPSKQLRTALDELKAQMSTRIREYERRLREEDYQAHKPIPLKMDETALGLRRDLSVIRDKWEKAREADRLARREPWQRWLDQFVRWERAFKLSSVAVFGKLVSAATTRAVTTAVEEGVGGGMAHVPLLSTVSRQAPREGGLNVKALAKGYTEGATEGFRDAWDRLTKDKTRLDELAGRSGLDRDWANFVGRLHDVLKSPVMRGEYALSLEKRITHAIANGVDVTDPMVMQSLRALAVNDGLRSKFMQKGPTSGAFNVMISSLERNKQFPVSGEVLARTARFLLPVVRVPLNIVGESALGATGVPMASTRVMYHVVKGTLNDLDPVVADSILRQFKKGSIGLGLIAIGFLNPQAIGGYDWREKRKASDAKTAGFQVKSLAGVWPIDDKGNVPRWMTHAPWFELMQMGATIRHVKDQHVKDDYGNLQQKGISEGAWAAAMGLIEQTPFYGEMERVTRAAEGGKQLQAFAGEMARGTLLPQGVQQIARWIDEVEKRKARNMKEEIELGIPGLRQNVPPAKVKP